MRIAWERSIYVGNGRVRCILCGHWFVTQPLRNQQALIAVVYNDQGVVYGEACRSCVTSGSEGIKECLQERITSLQTQLQDLQELNQGEVRLPTLEEELQSHLGSLPPD